MREIRLGKIEKVSFGMGGYQDVMIGISFTLSADGWGVQDFWGDWSMKRTEHTQWTEQERIIALGKTVMRISELLKDAKRPNIAELKGVPIEVTFDSGSLVSWRILKEVI